MVEENQSNQTKSDTTREIIEDLKEWSGKVFRKVREEAGTLSTKGKLKLDLTSLKSKRGTEFKELGSVIFSLLEEGKYDIPEAASNVDRIRGLAEEIRKREKKMREAGRKPEVEEATGDKGEPPGE
jgi:hypothetical protein